MRIERSVGWGGGVADRLGENQLPYVDVGVYTLEVDELDSCFCKRGL